MLKLFGQTAGSAMEKALESVVSIRSARHF